MAKDIDLHAVRDALDGAELTGFAAIVEADGIVEIEVPRASRAKVGNVKPPPLPPA